MKLLRNERAWRRWIQTVAGATSRDYERSPSRPPLVINFSAPTQYPCWAYAEVADWQAEYEVPRYLYRADLERMLAAAARAADGEPAFPASFFPSRASGRRVESMKDLLRHAAQDGPGWVDDGSGEGWTVGATYEVRKGPPPQRRG